MDIDKWIKEAEHKAGLASENNRLDDMHYNRGIADCLKALKISTYGPESNGQGEKIKESCFSQTIKQRIMKTFCG